MTLKIASTIDSKIALSSFESKWITSKSSRLIGHTLRLKNDCLLTTSQTVIKDNPIFDCRLDGLVKYSPDIFIIDRELKIDLSFKIFKRKYRKIYIFHSVELRKGQLKKYSQKNIKLIYVSQNNELLNIEEIIYKIADNGYQSILTEGGGRIATSLLSRNLVDSIYWFKASKFIGQEGISAIEKLGIKKMNSIKNFKLSKVIKLGDDTLNVFAKKDDYMFSGIIDHTGKIRKVVEKKNKDITILVSTKFSSKQIKLGSSICCNGVCLTVCKINKKK